MLTEQDAPVQNYPLLPTFIIGVVSWIDTNYFCIFVIWSYLIISTKTDSGDIRILNTLLVHCFAAIYQILAVVYNNLKHTFRQLPVKSWISIVSILAAVTCLPVRSLIPASNFLLRTIFWCMDHKPSMNYYKDDCDASCMILWQIPHCPSLQGTLISKFSGFFIHC